jgi:hypothetical protein
VNAQAEAKQKPRIDLAFCIDTTGSMQGEIDAVKTKTKEIVAKLSGSKPTPDVRGGGVAYRDRGDEYVTKVFQFSDNIDKVVKDISSLKADGGGDAPEAVNQALHASVNDLNWSTDKKTVKLLFLIGDAGPHAYPGDYDYKTESKNAITKGIQINTIACDGLYNSVGGLEVFQQIAKLAEGKCEFLTYKQDIVDAGGRRSTVVSSAGKLYKVDGSSADWRTGADKLVARGFALPVAAKSTAAYAAASPMALDAPAPSSAPRGFMSRARSAEASAVAPSAMGYSAGAFSAGGGGAGGAVSRTDSNLADIVLSATKDAAKKKANIDYKD